MQIKTNYYILLSLLGYFLFISLIRNFPLSFPYSQFILPQVYFLSVLVLGNFLNVYSFKKIGLNLSGLHSLQRQKIKRTIVLSAMIIVALSLISVGIIRLIFPEWYIENHTSAYQLPSLAILFLSIITAPICEELYFRGIIYNEFRKIFPLSQGVILSALIFMTVHLSFHVGAFFLGVVCAFLFEKSNSIWPPIVFHSVCNIISFMIFFFIPDIQTILDSLLFIT